MPDHLRRVRGFPDKLASDCLHFDHVVSQAVPVIKSFCFERIESPILEYTDLFVKTLGKSSDIVHKEMYSFSQNQDNLTLRPEGTAATARLFITENLHRELPFKCFYYGPMFRSERPQKARFRQFYQLGVEAFGIKNETIDVEVLSMAWLIMKSLKIDNQITVEINSIGQLSERQTYKKKLIKFLKSFKQKLSPDSQRRLVTNPLRIWDSKEKSDQDILKKAPLLIEDLKKESLTKYENIKQHLSTLHIPFTENFKLVRGLDYYNDFVFEFKSPQLGSQSGVLAGGRYDSLIQTLGGLDTPATGWGAGLERLMLLCKPVTLQTNKIGLVSIGNKAQNKALHLAYQMRANQYTVYYNFSGNISKQMKRISQQKCQVALFYGEQEHTKNQIRLKNLKTQKQIDIPFEKLDQYLLKYK